MKGDFSRLTFAAEKHYDSVRMQQGRVQIDADWNEQRDIDEHLRAALAKDVIGACGAPTEGGGFEITFGGDHLDISPGCIYVDGILCELESKTNYSSQSDYPSAVLPTEAGTYLAYLDVWRRHITALEDPQIREVALGGPETATRTKTVAQVKLFRLGDETLDLDSAEVLSQWESSIAASSGRLLARAESGYQSSENQLYRVEIHDPAGPTFKWARDNASLCFQIGEAVGDKIKVAIPGRNALLDLRPGDWIELLDDSIELSKGFGEFAQITLIDTESNELTLDKEISLNMDAHPKLRRWEGLAEEIPTGNDAHLLDPGIEVKFSDPPATYRACDYWLIPARTATAHIDWPQDESGPVEQAPHGIQHHYCQLAIVTLDSTDNWELVKDCRDVFQPLASKAVQPPAPEAIRVENVTLTHATESSLENDSTTTTDELIGGLLQIHCDTVLELVLTSSTRNPVCVVTIDVPLSLDYLSQGHPLLTIGKGQFLGYQPIQLAGKVKIGASGKTIEWTPNEQAATLLFTTVESTEPLLTHLTVKGEAFREGGEHQGELYLRPGSDFEMWFWVEISPS